MENRLMYYSRTTVSLCVSPSPQKVDINSSEQAFFMCLPDVPVPGVVYKIVKVSNTMFRQKVHLKVHLKALDGFLLFMTGTRHQRHSEKNTTWCRISKSALGAELDTKMHLALWSVELHLDFTLRAQMRVTPGTAHIFVHNDAVPILIHLMTGKHNLLF